MRTLAILSVAFATTALAAPPKKRSVRVAGPATAVAFDPEGRLLAAGGADGQILLSYVDSGDELRTIAAHAGPVRALVFATDGSTLYSAADDGAIRVWSPVDGSKRAEALGHEGPVRALSLTKFGETLVSGGHDGTLRLWDTGSMREIARHADIAPVWAVAARKREWVAFGGPANPMLGPRHSAKLYDGLKRRLHRTVGGQIADTLAVDIREDGLAASGGASKEVVFWAAPSTENFMRLAGHTGTVRAVRFRSDGKLLASGADDGTIRLWDVRGDVLRDSATAGSPVHSIAFSESGKWLAGGLASGEVGLWDVSSLSGQMTLPPNKERQKEAEEHFGKSEIDAAIAKLQAILQSEPKNADARVLLGRSFLEQKKFPEAIKEIEQAGADDKKHYVAHLILGIIAKSGEQWDKAIAEFQLALAANPTDAGTHTHLAQSYAKKGRHGLAGRHNLAAYDILPGAPESAYNLACSYALAGQKERSLIWFERALQLGAEAFDTYHADPELAAIRSDARYAALLAKHSGDAHWARRGGSPDRATALAKEAETARKAENWAVAAPKYREAIAEERATATPRTDQIRMWLFWLGTWLDKGDDYAGALRLFKHSHAVAKSAYSSDAVYRFTLVFMAKIHARFGENEQALALYEEAIGMHKKEKEDDMIAVNQRRVGELLTSMGRYDEAKKRLDEGLELATKLGKTQGIVDSRQALAALHVEWGQQKEALDQAKKALEVARTLNDPGELAQVLTEVGNLHAKLGENGTAVALFEEAIRESKKDGNPRRLSLAINHLARFHSGLARHDEAVKLTLEALGHARASKNDSSLTAAISAAASVYDAKGEHAEAAKLYDEGLELARRLGRANTIGSMLTLSARQHRKLEKYDVALPRFEEALGIARERGELPDVARTLFDIAQILHVQERYDEASHRVGESVQIYEQLRKATTDEARREFLAKQISAYSFLAMVQLRANKTFDAYRTIELGRAKMLAEKLAVDQSDATIPTIPELQALAGDGAILSYGATEFDAVAAMAVDTGGIVPRVRGLGEMIATGMKEHGKGVSQALASAATGKRGVRRKPSEEGSPSAEAGLSDLIHYYRFLMSNPSPVHDQIQRKLGHLLYTSLVKPMIDRVGDKKRLIIVPDGVLALVPFETLIDDEGRFLAERFDISYAQSLGVLRLIEKRKHPEGRKPMLALGGAVYEVKGATPPTAYARLGYADWADLPGTLSEVKALSRLVVGAETITGREVAESRIKKLSGDGALKSYRVLHFATHGLVVPEAPALSALVLSLSPDPGQDGYLQMGEIARLDLAADFVNLSACETGLGRIYGGEGVVGLTQAFMIAGANALSVSLWQVADESTSKLMQEVYALVQGQGLGYAEAFAEVKRGFIAGKYGKAWSSPHYWAPFVYYGARR